jgi:hypothetical protein
MAKKCIHCGRFLPGIFDGENIVATCWDDSFSINDDEATNRFWQRIDQERINNNPAWREELLQMDAPTIASV